MSRAGFPKPDFSAVSGKRLLIALSGGSDSVALTAMLSECREELSIHLEAAHLNHGIRPESAADAEFCRRLCADLDIPFHLKSIDVPAEAARMGAGLETAARELRYAYLESVRIATRSDYIALAHHMDDQAETVLMHLARGAGPGGLCGMRKICGHLYRPLLSCRKAELTDYVRSVGLSWREDSTNAVADTPRNAIRLNVIPALEKSYPQFACAVSRCALSAQIEGDFVSECADSWLQGRVGKTDFGLWVDLDELPHPAVLRRALIAVCPAESDWNRLNALHALCEARKGKFDLGRDWLAERTGRRLYFVRKRRPPIEPVPLAIVGEIALPGICRIEAAPSAPIPVRDDPMRQCVNTASLRGTVLRTRRPGDRFRPLGTGDRLLSDYLTDRKIDRPLRDSIALIAREDRVLWVCGLGLSEDAKLGDDTQSAAILTCRYDFSWFTKA